MERFNILGAGVMGRQITALLCLAGYDVYVWNHPINDEIKALLSKEIRVMERILKNHDEVGRINYVANIRELEPLTTFESLVEDINIKRDIISLLPYEIKEGQLITNTSSYSPVEIHKNAIGLHFYNPIYYLRFAELSCSIEITEPSIKTLIDKLKNTFGFEFITTSNNRGYIGNYLVFREIADALKLIDKYHYKTGSIDKVLFHMGRKESIFDLIDLVGVDICQKIILNLKEEDDSLYYSSLLDLAISRNILGKKNKTSIRTIIDKEK